MRMTTQFRVSSGATSQGTGSPSVRRSDVRPLLSDQDPVARIAMTDTTPTLAHGSRPADTGYDEYRILDALGVAVYATDPAGLITYFNEAAVEFWGWRPALGEEWFGSLRLFWPDGSPMAHGECPMALTLREGRPIRGQEAILERPDGSRAWFAPLPSPLRDGDGAIVGAVNVLIDVTVQREAQTALHAAAEALRASNTVKDEFLGLVSHELRTPITTIFGNATMLQHHRDTLTDPDVAILVADVAAEAERLRDIIENLLTLSRLGSAGPSEREPQILARVVDSARRRFVSRHPARRLDTLAPSDLLVEADATSLQLVLENLLTNSDKYSPAGSVIELRVERNGAEARVAVLDRGMGIPEGDAVDVFEPFFRGAEAQRRASGMGIGLTVCKRLVEDLGGTLSANRRPGGGTEMAFDLPLFVVSD